MSTITLTPLRSGLLGRENNTLTVLIRARAPAAPEGERPRRRLNLSLVIDRLRYANYGFTGKWFGGDKIDAERLEKVLAFDTQLAEGVDKAVGDIASLELLDDDAAITSALNNLARHLRDMDEALNRREEILRAVGGDPEK